MDGAEAAASARWLTVRLESPADAEGPGRRPVRAKIAQSCQGHFDRRTRLRLHPPQRRRWLRGGLKPAAATALVGTVRAAVDERVQRLVRVPSGQVHNDRVQTVGYGRDAVALRGAKPPHEAGAVLCDPVDAVSAAANSPIRGASSGARCRAMLTWARIGT